MYAIKRLLCLELLLEPPEHHKQNRKLKQSRQRPFFSTPKTGIRKKTVPGFG